MRDRWHITLGRIAAVIYARAIPFSRKIYLAFGGGWQTDREANSWINANWTNEFCSGLDGAAKGYAQPSGQVADDTSSPLMEFASAKGNGYAV